jgi:adenylate kinase family enzyme
MLSHRDRLVHRPRRVLVAGVSGAGKTTLAARIAAITGAEHTEIDALFHGPNWTPRAEFVADVHRLVSADSWTTEWQYDAARPLLAERADLLVWLDLPFLRVTLPRVVRRTVRRRWHREELWNGNMEAPLLTFFTDRDHIIRWAIRTRRKYSWLMPQFVNEYPGVVVVRLRSQQEVDAWLGASLLPAVSD